jgi:precorrin-4/cobalt-precorrin-4 C11-methyltransferase
VFDAIDGKTHAGWQILVEGDTIAAVGPGLTAPADARVIDTAPMSLDEIEAEFVAAHERERDVARLHSGDLSVWSALGEQLRRLRKLEIPFTITPGVPAFAASAAALGVELTLPELTQSVVLTRTSGRASAMPERERLEHFAATGATLAIHLSVHVLEDVVARVSPHYGPDCPVAIVFRASWPDQRILRGTLAEIVAQTRETSIDRTATILIGPALAAEDFRESALYSPDYQRRFRGRGESA